MIYTERQKKRRTQKTHKSQFSLHVYNEIVYTCNNKILVIYCCLTFCHEYQHLVLQ